MGRARDAVRAHGKSCSKAWRWLLWLIVAGCVAGPGTRARAEPAPGDAVALLPLDAEPSLEIYGQPIASALARALVAGNVQVVVVGPRMAVPERARLIIDGTIALGKTNAVTISIRIRNTLDGMVLATLSATAPGLAKIDGAAAELAARVVPSVHDKLAALERSPDHHDHGRVVQTPRPPVADRVVLVAVSDATTARNHDPLFGALDAAVAEWTRAHHHPPQKIDPGKLEGRLVARTIAASGSDLAIGLWILGYTPEAGELPMARARVRVQIADASAVRFDRVVVTDTVLGDRGLSQADLAARVAREILAILRPHLRRHVPWW
ncbi:MAG TPA: hypothetical protein VHN14_09465 [Kofleriaceae bacterium]|nr:hypothetical protein [Kofleriaceae bacterium]